MDMEDKQWHWQESLANMLHKNLHHMFFLLKWNKNEEKSKSEKSKRTIL